MLVDDFIISFPLILSKALALQGFSISQHINCCCSKDFVEVVFFQLVNQLDLKGGEKCSFDWMQLWNILIIPKDTWMILQFTRGIAGAVDCLTLRFLTPFMQCNPTCGKEDGLLETLAICKAAFIYDCFLFWVSSTGISRSSNSASSFKTWTKYVTYHRVALLD